MNKSIKNIYIPKLRFKGFDNQYNKIKLCDVLFYEQPTKYIVKSDEYNDSFDTPVLTANKSFILGKTDEKTGIYSKGPVIIFDDFTTENKYVDFDFKVKSSAIKFLTTDSKNNLFYLYQLININPFTINGHNRHWIRFSSQEIKWICSLEEQEKISKFFSLLDQQILLLENKLQLIEQKFKYFLNGLFNLHNEKSILRFKTFNNKWRLKKIEEITTFMKSGGTPKSRSDLFYSNNGIPFLAIPDMKNKYLLKTDKHITNLAVEKTSTFIFEKDNLVYSIYATIGEISINKIDVALPQSILGIKADKTVIKNEYLYYLLKSNKNKILRLKQTGSQPNLSLEIFKNISLYISLNLEEQSKISKFLNLFDLWKETVKNNIYLVKKRKEHFLKQMF